ncbi:substrate-binding periplasmic protein [Dongia sp.]|uniref:substrate-binding periplasmic protein n=1 Tax=Dongia sp. TaxID=1977262 RepID=UPI0035B2C5BF
MIRFFRLAFLCLIASFAGATPVPAKEPVRIAFAIDLTPLSFEEGGAARGIFVDLAREAFEKRLQVPLSVNLYPWARAQQMVREGTADGFITVATKARQEYANCGRIPVLRVPLHPLVRADDPKMERMNAAASLADLKPFKIISYLGNGWAKENLADFNVHYAADFGASINGLAAGRGDLAFATTVAGGYYLREHNLAGQLTMLPLVVDDYSYVLCLGKNSPMVGLLSEFDRVIEVMRAEGAYHAILRRYGLDLNVF